MKKRAKEERNGKQAREFILPNKIQKNSKKQLLFPLKFAIITKLF